MMPFLRTNAFALLVGAVGVLASVVGHGVLADRERERAQREFTQVAKGVADHLRDTVADLVHDAEGLALVATLQPDLKREHFATAARYHRERRAPIGSLLWIERVPGVEREAFEARMRGRGEAGYRVSERDAEGRVVPAPARDEYFVSVFMEPRPTVASAQGFNLASNAERRRAMEAARDSGRSAMTGRIRVVTEPDRPEALQIFAPIYSPGAMPSGVEERRARLRGFMAVLLPIRDLERQVVRDHLPPGWGLALRVGGALSERREVPVQAGDGARRIEIPLRVLGLPLDVEISAPAAAVPPEVHVFLVAGLLVSLAMAILVAQRTRSRRQRAEAAARHRLEMHAVEQQLHAAMDVAPEPMALKDRSLRYVFANAAFCALFGRAREDIVGRTQDDLYPPEEAAAVRAQDEECIRTGQSRRHEFRHVYPASGDRWFELLKAPVVGDDGRVIGVISIAHDITLRRAAEAARDREAEDRVREALERYRLATEAAGIWVFGIDLATDRLMADAGAVRHLGYAPGEFPETSTGWRDRLVRPSHHAAMHESVVAHLQGRTEQIEFNAPTRARDGREVWLSVRARAERDEAGRAIRVIGTVHDITDRMRASMALAESEERWQSALEGAGHGVWDWDALTDKVYYSRRWKAMLGYGEDEIGKTLDEWKSRVHPDDLGPCLAELERHVSGAAPVYASEHRMRCKDGSWKWISDRGRVVARAADGRPLRIIGTHTDIDARKAAEQELADAAERQRAVLDNLLAAVIVIDERGTIEKFSRQAEAVFGWTEAEVLGRNVSMLMPAAVAAAHDGYLSRYAGGGPAFIVGSTRELSGRRKDGSEVPLELGVTEYRIRGQRRYTGMVRDLSARRRAEQALADSEERFRQLFESSPEPIVVHVSGNIEALNPAAVRMYGGRFAEELLGRSIVDFINPSMHARAVARIESLMEAPGTLPPQEYPQRRLDGSEIFVEATSASIRQGGRMRIVSLYRDITARKQADGALAASERRLRQVIDLVPHLIFARDREGRYLLSNRAHAEFYGRTPAEMLALDVRAIGLDPQELASTVEGDGQVWATGRMQHDLRATRIDRQGRRREFDIVKMPFSHAGGEIDAVLGISIDVTELYETQRELKASLALLEATLESVDNGVVVTDMQGRVLRWNAAAPDLVGVPAQTLEGGDRASVLAKAREKIVNRDEVAVATARIDAGHGDRTPTVARFADGRSVERLTTPIVVDGVPRGRLWSFRDVTAREREKQAAALRATELERLVAERTSSLEEAVRDLNLFTSAVSHDLRAPLRAVEGFARLALEAGDVLPAGARQQLGRVISAVGHMSAMVEGLLALARQARAPLNRRAVDLSALAREVAGEFEHEAGRRVDWRIADTPAAQADPALMRAVLQNLLGNALKYTRDRDPAVIEFGAEAGEWFVRDNGAGFDPQYAGKLFQPFVRLHSPREFEGTGIGLAAVHRILERHGGGIRAESAPGRGATFRFRVGPG